MSYIITSTEIFKKQLDEFDEKTKKIIQEKIQLIKENPFRNKKIHSKKFSRVFRIRLNINRKEINLCNNQPKNNSCLFS